MAHLVRFAYQLRHHRFGTWALDRWAVTLAWGAAVLLLLQWALRGRPALPAWHWTALALLILAGGGVLALRVWAAHRGCVVFTPEIERSSPEPGALAPEDKIPLWATGRFEVEDRTAFSAHLQAFWRTFATQEHAIMAIQHPSRFLLVGHTPAEQAGMWYIFIPGGAVEGVTPGQCAFGAAQGPALRVVYRRPTADQGARRPARRNSNFIRETVYLLFDEEQTRARVWADLILRR